MPPPEVSVLGFLSPGVKVQILGPGTPAPVPSTATFEDSFTDTEGVILDAHTPDIDDSGLGWTLQNGSVEIGDSNFATLDLPVPGVPRTVATFDPGTADGVIDATCIWTHDNPNSTYHGIIFRYQNNANHWMCVRSHANGGTIRLSRYVGGSFSDVVTLVVGPDRYLLDHFRVVLDGDNIKAYHNGVLFANITDTFNETETEHGIRYSQKGAHVDHIRFDPVLVGTTDWFSVVTPNRFQRVAPGSHVVSGSHFTNTAPTAIQCNHGSGYATIDASPAANSFSGNFAFDYSDDTFIVRPTNVPAASFETDVICAFILALAGQSNQAGLGTNLQDGTPYTRDAALSLANTTETTFWRALEDPTSGSGDGSFHPLSAAHIIEDQDVPVAFIQAAEPGSGLVAPDPDWTQGGAQYDKLLDWLNSGAIIGDAHVSFNAGGKDMVNGVSYAAWVAAIGQFLADMRVDTGMSTMKCIVGVAGEVVNGATDDQVNAIRWANTDAADLPGFGYGHHGYDVALPDGLHWKTDVQLAELAGREFPGIIDTFFGGSYGRGPRVSSFIQNSDNYVITYDQDLDVSVVNYDVIAWHFDEDDGTARAVSSATRTGTRVVTVTLDGTIDGAEPRLYLGFGNEAAAAGNAIVPTGVAIALPRTFHGVSEIHQIAEAGVIAANEFTSEFTGEF